ncbi:hypothetical protein PVAP13_1KG103854 [Panicum virgatum]|uniref:Uncharacterized protein n=1 Tax=Panicum virgatum TaxID=38727 RepID=A0A8T0XC74_PANVG|nr:hypothetical protein PVAP13_1KG103854 [Panicum virgatum]
MEDPHGTSLLAADTPFDNGKGLQKSSLCRPVAKPWCEAEYKRFRKLSSVLAMNCHPSLQGAGWTISRQPNRARDLNVPWNKNFDLPAGI